MVATARVICMAVCMREVLAGPRVGVCVPLALSLSYNTEQLRFQQSPFDGGVTQRTFIAFDEGERNPIAIDFPVHFLCSQKKDKKRAVMGTVI